MIAGWMRPIIVLWFLAGAVVELFNAWTRRRVVERLAPERRPRSVGWFMGGFVVRVMLTAGVLVLAFRDSLASGLMAFLGYYLCRTVVVWREVRRPGRSPGEGGSLYDVGSKNG